MEILIWVAVLAVMLGGLYVAVQSPGFWLQAGRIVVMALLPVITKRMSEEDEKRWRNIQLRGGDKDELRKFEDERRRRK